MARKNGLNKRAIAEANRAYQAWLHDPDDNTLEVFFMQAYRSGYRFGRQVERQEWNEAAGVGGSDDH
jgi:hypothetical protein